tara:strand:- start:2359 stop:2511 length:153 start_codon:yes stop_codon:yes gene_type:complete
LKGIFIIIVKNDNKKPVNKKINIDPKPIKLIFDINENIKDPKINIMQTSQ